MTQNVNFGTNECSARPHGRARIETLISTLSHMEAAGSARPHGRARIETISVAVERSTPVTVAPGLTVGRGLKLFYRLPSLRRLRP